MELKFKTSINQPQIQPPKNPFENIGEGFSKLIDKVDKVAVKAEEKIKEAIDDIKDAADTLGKGTVTIVEVVDGALKGKSEEEIAKNAKETLFATNTKEAIKSVGKHKMNQIVHVEPQKQVGAIEKQRFVPNNTELELTTDKMLHILSTRNADSCNNYYELYDDFGRLTNVDLSNVGISVNEFEQMNTLIDYGYYQNVKTVMLGVAVSPEAIFEAIYKSPTFVTDGVLALSNKLRIPYSSSFSLEDILRYYMGQANKAEVATNFIKGFGYMTKAGCYFYDLMVKSYQKISQFNDSTGSHINIINLRPVFLAALWAAMMFDLSAHDSLSVNEKGVVKLAMSLVLTSIVGATSYMHSGGRAFGFKSPTSYSRVYLNAQKLIEDRYPYQYKTYVPNFLKFSIADDFDKFIRSEQISTGKGLNMAYTFRVGDIYISNMIAEKAVDTSCLKKVLSSLKPIPTNEEAERVYRLYVEQGSLYNY